MRRSGCKATTGIATKARLSTPFSPGPIALKPALAARLRRISDRNPIRLRGAGNGCCNGGLPVPETRGGGQLAQRLEDPELSPPQRLVQGPAEDLLVRRNPGIVDPRTMAPLPKEALRKLEQAILAEGTANDGRDAA